MKTKDKLQLVGWLISQYGPHYTLQQLATLLHQELTQERAYPPSIAELLTLLGANPDGNYRRRFYNWLKRQGLLEDLQLPNLSFAIKNPTALAVKEGYAKPFNEEQNEFTREGLKALLQQFACPLKLVREREEPS